MVTTHTQDLLKCLTRDEVEAFLVLHAGFNLTGEQVESGWRFVRLRERRGVIRINRSIKSLFVKHISFWLLLMYCTGTLC